MAVDLEQLLPPADISAFLDRVETLYPKPMPWLDAQVAAARMRLQRRLGALAPPDPAPLASFLTSTGLLLADQLASFRKATAHAAHAAPQPPAGQGLGPGCLLDLTFVEGLLAGHGAGHTGLPEDIRKQLGPFVHPAQGHPTLGPLLPLLPTDLGAAMVSERIGALLQRVADPAALFGPGKPLDGMLTSAMQARMSAEAMLLAGQGSAEMWAKVSLVYCNEIGLPVCV